MENSKRVCHLSSMSLPICLPKVVFLTLFYIHKVTRHEGQTKRKSPTLILRRITWRYARSVPTSRPDTCRASVEGSAAGAATAPTRRPRCRALRSRRDQCRPGRHVSSGCVGLVTGGVPGPRHHGGGRVTSVPASMGGRTMPPPPAGRPIAGDARRPRALSIDDGRHCKAADGDRNTRRLS